jgi:hypothetical protein
VSFRSDFSLEDSVARLSDMVKVAPPSILGEVKSDSVFPDTYWDIPEKGTRFIQDGSQILLIVGQKIFWLKITPAEGDIEQP